MNIGRIDFTRVGSDEVVGSYPYSNGLRTLCLVRLNKAKNREVATDTNALGTYIAFTAGELAGIEGIELPSPRDVTPESLALMMLEWDFALVEPDRDERPEERVEDENPTATSGASS